MDELYDNSQFGGAGKNYGCRRNFYLQVIAKRHWMCYNALNYTY